MSVTTHSARLMTRCAQSERRHIDDPATAGSTLRLSEQVDVHDPAMRGTGWPGHASRRSGRRRRAPFRTPGLRGPCPIGHPHQIQRQGARTERSRAVKHHHGRALQAILPKFAPGRDEDGSPNIVQAESDAEQSAPWNSSDPGMTS